MKNHQNGAASSLHLADLHDRFIITEWASRNESVTELFPAFARGGASNLLPLTKLAGNALVWGNKSALLPQTMAGKLCKYAIA